VASARPALAERAANIAGADDRDLHIRSRTLSRCVPPQPEPAGGDGPWRHVLKRGDFPGKYGK
jgi:hypothetical protein